MPAGAVNLKILDGDGTARNVKVWSSDGTLAGDLSFVRLAIKSDGTVVDPDYTPSAIAAGQVSVTTTAAVLVAARAGRKSVTIINLGTTDVFIGSSASVTPSNGALLPGIRGAALTIDGGAAIWGDTASGTQTVSFLESF